MTTRKSDAMFMRIDVLSNSYIYLMDRAHSVTIQLVCEFMCSQYIE